LFVFTALSGSLFAQEIAGTVVDQKNQPMINAAIQVFQGGILKGGVVTDYDGNYVVKPLDPGTYDVIMLYPSYDSFVTKGIVVTPGNRTTINAKMAISTGHVLTAVTITWSKPIVDKDKPGATVLTRKEINQIPTMETKDLVGLTPALYQSQRGKDVNIGGARTDGTLYVIDGVQVRGQQGVNMSQGSVEQLEVITSGIPAKYGDVSGGVINITSRGVSQKLTGDIRAQHSIDGYNNNLVSFSLAGPLFKKRIDSTHKKPVLGFALSGDYYDDHNRYPSFIQEYTVKDDVLQRLQANPLHISSDNSGLKTYNYSSNYLTLDSLKQVKQPPHSETKEYRLNGKLDYQMTDNMRIAAGGMVDYLSTPYDNYSRLRRLMDADGIPQDKQFTGRAYIRFTQKFGKANDTSKGIISNAFYTVQADYQNTYRSISDPTFGDDIFHYGYIGKFTESRQNIYTANTKDSVSGYKAVVLTGSNTSNIDYNRYAYGNYNSTMANYTTQYYNSLNGAPVTSIENQIQGVALANGDQPRYTYTYNGTGLYNSPGDPFNQTYKSNSNQYALSVDASFDLQVGKTKHAIEFGLYYQQRIEKSYSAYSNLGGSISLWSLMRGLLSTPSNNKLTLDKSHPIFLVNGVKYNYDATTGKFTDPSGAVANIIPGPTDTILYNYKNVGTSTFDKNLRNKLGLKDNDFINMDQVDPSKLALNMFSADELLNLSGNPFVSYYGYNYDGSKQTGAVNFNDFWTQKDANGNFTRPIAAFSPNYIAGYVQDRFDYKDFHFNIGVRIDRYSANTKALIDPYSLYSEKKLGDVAGSLNLVNGGTHPSNLGSDYVVYVNDNNATAPSIIGYRSGNNWYDPTGKFIEDPSVLKQYSNGRDPQPYINKSANGTLVKMTDSSFNPNSAFTDYKPQVNVMPRLQFSFPISDVANFYAHYDIYVQRPTNGYNTATAFDYYQLSAAAPTNTITNSNLKPQKTFDYEVGFQQKLTAHSGLTITGFYKERKDMIALRTIVNAFPYSYTTYDNRDFSTTKGSTLLYDMRATNHLSLNVSYTLQFAEGTGSTPGGGKGLLSTLIQEGFPNIRYVTALDYDARHNINARIDYRFNDGEGPEIGGLKVFQNAGVDFIVKTRSGEPYTRYADALGQTVVGGVNGSRLPWHFGTDMRIDKDFALAWGNRNKASVEGVKPKHNYYIKAILMVNNLFNTREILGVYGYTGRPDDNGYLTSALGQRFVPQQVNPQSFTDLYSVYLLGPNRINGSAAYLNYARTINFSLEFNF
jgi:hypothetical protein